MEERPRITATVWPARSPSAQLTADEQEMLCRYTRPVHYRKGARVHSPLESCVGILLLRTGQLRAYLLSEDGRDVTSTACSAGKCASCRRPA